MSRVGWLNLFTYAPYIKRPQNWSWVDEPRNQLLLAYGEKYQEPTFMCKVVPALVISIILALISLHVPRLLYESIRRHCDGLIGCRGTRCHG
jgi:hypothetical protein